MKKVKRLYGSFRPEHYKLSLDIDKAGLAFEGTVVIAGKKVGPPSKRITLHQKDLRIKSVRVTRLDKKDSQELKVSRIVPHKAYDEVRLHFDQTTYPGNYEVELEFSGKISRAMHGLYPCFFKHGGKEKTLLATQFESHHAREVFPCIDEPEAKATFDLQITDAADKNQTVLANTPVKSQTLAGSKRTTTFETTPVMSTYLLAFAIGEFGYKEAKTTDGVTIRAYATPDNVAFTDFALDTAVKCLEFYNEYFGIPYPLEKCDLVALPDFASGAMENWGLITYREQAVLVDPKNSTLSNKQWVAMVVSHELAHQWFGNLVTMRWWTDLWLNEGFASWIEYLAIDHIFPDWDIWTQFIATEQQAALKLDALENTHPVEVPVNHPDEIRSIFDTISYSKGASVIHMLHDYLGADYFKKGLRHYLKKHSHKNTDTVDLWASLEEESGKPVKAFMHDWTAQSGFPMIEVDAGDKLRLTQRRFVINPKSRLQDGTIWQVPLLDGKNLPSILDKQSAGLDIASSDFTKINQGQSGFYRVAYDSGHLARLGSSIKAGELAPLDRLGILSDAFEAAKAGRLPTVDALNLLESFGDEDNSAVWDIITGNISSLRSVMDDEPLREAMKPFIVQLVRKQLDRLGWEVRDSDSHFDKLLRPTVISLAAAAAEEPATVKTALDKFNKMQQLEDVHPDVRGIVYTTAARQLNDQATFDKLAKLYKSTTLSEEHITLAAGITHFRDSKLIDRSLELIDSPLVRHQDIAYWVIYSLRNRYARDATWQWLTKNWKWLEESIGGDLSFYRFPVYVAGVFSDAKFIKEYKAFFEPRSNPALERSIKQGVEILEWHSAWRTRDLESIKAYFKAK